MNTNIPLHVYEQIVEQSSATIVVTDREGAITYVNPAFTLITGYTKEEAIGCNPRIIQSGKTQKEVYVNLWNTILSGKTWKGELMNKKKNGEYYWEVATISPITDESGHITHFVAVKDECTERKRLEEEYVQRSKELERINTLMIGRELRMKELKQEIEQLKKGGSL